MLKQNYPSYRLVFVCYVGVHLRAIVILQRQISLPNASRPASKASGWKILKLVVNFFPTQPGVVILARKNRMVMNWYNFFGQEYSFFNPIVSCLIALKTLKSQIIFGALPLKPHKSSALNPCCNYDRFAIALSLIKFNLPLQNGYQLKCLDKSLLLNNGDSLNRWHESVQLFKISRYLCTTKS